MKITRIDIKLSQASNQKLKAYASVAFDNDLIVRNFRIIKGKNDELFVAFPNVEKKRICKSCGTKVSFKDSFCRKCGKELPIILSGIKYKSVVSLSENLRKEVIDGILNEYKNKLSSVSSKE